MSLINTAQINALTRLLDATVARQQAVATNIANVDTPGYRTKEVDFRRMLQSTSESLIPTGTQPQLREVQGLMERPDGNNVSLEREGLALADTQLQFQTGVQLLKAEFHRLQLAINEGK